MSANIPNWYYQQFNANVALALQQKKSRLRTSCTEKTGYTGKSASVVDFLSPVEMQEVGARFAPMPRVDAQTTRRWIAPFDNELPQLIDSFDKLKLLTDPGSQYVQNAVAAAERKIDDRIGVAFFGPAMTGENGNTVTNFEGAQVVGVSIGAATSNLNVAKLNAARKLFIANQVDLEAERIHVCITNNEDAALRAEIQLVSLEYNAMPVFDPETGLLKAWNGFIFHYSERSWITTTAQDDLGGQSRAIPAWVPSGMHVGLWDDTRTNITQRNDLSGEPWQAYTRLAANATRIDEKRVVKIWCR